MPEHDEVIHGVGALAALSTGSTEAVERILSTLDPEQLTRLAAHADALAQACLALAHPNHSDGIPADVIASAQRQHQQAVPRVYDVRQGGWMRPGQLPPVVLGQTQPDEGTTHPDALNARPGGPVVEFEDDSWSDDGEG